MLTDQQINEFQENGFTIARGLLSGETLDALSDQLDAWTDESRSHEENYGFDTFNGRARFDLQPGHSAATPMLRRVTNPADISDAYQKALWEGPIVEAITDLIGPDVRFHHCKTNTKAPGAATKVDWHQDHAFTPLSNPDMVTVLVMLDETTEANGALQVVSGSHKTPYSHYQGDIFVGAISDEDAAAFEGRIELIEGKPGDVIFMHTWAVHGGGHNATDRPRRLVISEYMAADAVPLVEGPIATEHTGRLLAGRDLKIARLVQTEVELPLYEDDSFFGLQEKLAAQKAAIGDPA